MAIQMPLGGALLMHRLVRICTSRQGHQRYRELHPLLRIATRTWEVRTFSAGPKNGSENEDEAGNSSTPVPSLTPRQGLLSRRRPLSPLERISRLLPQDSLSPEVLQLRQENQEEPKVDTRGGDDPALKQDVSDLVMQPKSSDTQGNGSSCLSATLPGESLLVYGELLVAEYRKKGWVEFRKMFKLQEGMRLHSSWGTIGHDEIAGQPSGRFLRTHLGMAILVRRASLEDYVLYMKRGPAIAYPKDASSMLMMMDITEGDIVLESGSGSGAMSLFVSRAVGSKGKVLSVEVREDHHKTAVCNYNRWRASWRLRRGEEWPDNVCFHNADLRTASPLLAGWGFHSVALDLINPHLVLPTVIPHLHPGAVCAVYLAKCVSYLAQSDKVLVRVEAHVNFVRLAQPHPADAAARRASGLQLMTSSSSTLRITQVIDLLEGLRCLALPLLCERIIEVPVRDWLVAPARQKNGRFCTRKDPVVDQNQRKENAPSDDDQEMTVSDHPPFGSVPYIARPHPEQVSHTAFLVKLRKYTQ